MVMIASSHTRVICTFKLFFSEYKLGTDDSSIYTRKQGTTHKTAENYIDDTRLHLFQAADLLDLVKGAKVYDAKR